jgi:hypothetical protein
VLPLFALANAGVAFSAEVVDGRWPLALAIGLGLALGKPLGILLGCATAVATGLAVKPAGYTWRQLAGAGTLAGIGFTMSLFIAGQALPSADDFAAAKLAVLAASNLSAPIGVALLWHPARSESLEPRARRSLQGRCLTESTANATVRSALGGSNENLRRMRLQRFRAGLGSSPVVSSSPKKAKGSRRSPGCLIPGPPAGFAPVWARDRSRLDPPTREPLQL